MSTTKEAMIVNLPNSEKNAVVWVTFMPSGTLKKDQELSQNTQETHSFEPLRKSFEKDHLKFLNNFGVLMQRRLKDLER